MPSVRPFYRIPSLDGFLARIRAREERARGLRQLSRLDAHLLRDIGLTRADIPELTRKS